MINQTKKSKLKFYLLFILFAFILTATLRIYFRTTDDFRIANITYDIPYRSEWEIPPLTNLEKEQLDNILQQDFIYVGKGAQSYAFASEDERYILKFFKFKHLKPSFLVSILPDIPPFSEYISQVTLRKNRKLNSIFQGYRLAYDLNKEESGLLYIQLVPNGQEKLVSLIDKIGLKRTVDLGSVVYIIQEQGRTLRSTLDELLANQNVALAKNRISQIFSLYLSEYQKGIYDRDHGVLHNTGFVGERPFHLDVGKLSKDDNMKNPDVYHKDFKKVISRISPWLYENYPQYADELILHMESEANSKSYED